jgi:trimeric autotransporter adhesin
VASTAAPEGDSAEKAPEPPDSLAPITGPSHAGGSSDGREAQAAPVGAAAEPAAEPAAEKAEAPRSEPAPRKAEASGGGKSKGKSKRKSQAEPEPTSTRTPSARKLAIEDDETDKAFFEGAKEVEAKLHAEAKKAAMAVDVIEQPLPRVSITPELIAHRKRLRKIVQGVIGFCGLMSLLVVVRLVAGPKKSDAAQIEAPIAHAAMKVTEPAVAPRPAETAPAVPAATAAPTAAASDAAASGSASAEPTTSAAPAASDAPATSAAASASAPASSAAGGAPDPEKAKPLTRKALAALERSNFKGAIEHASASIEADPTDANAYLYWGTALMEMGKRAEAKVVFGKCVEQATRGRKAECRQFR